MKKYDSYMDSGIEWIGEIPEHWVHKPLKFIVECNRKVLSEKTESDKEIQYIEIGDVSSVEGIKTTTRYSFKDAPSRARRIVNSGDIIVSTVRTYLKAIAPISDKYDGFIASTGFAVLTPQHVNSKFLSNAMLCEGLIGDIISLSKGVSYPSITSQDLLGISIPYPPLEEQTTIANYLDHKTTQIDNLIAKKESLITLLQEERTAIINQAVTKGLDPTVPMKDSGIEWLGEIPQHWGVKPLKYVIRELESGVSVNSEDKPVTKKDEIGVLKTSCVYTYSFKSEENKSVLTEEYERVKCPVRADSIIISRMNTPELVGASGYVEKDYDNLYLPDRLWQTKFFDKEEINVRWLSKILVSDMYRNNISSRATGTSSSMKNISKDDLLTLPIPYPSKIEQDEIDKYISHKERLFSVTVEKTRKEIELLKEYKTALISEVVTGKVDVRDEITN